MKRSMRYTHHFDEYGDYLYGWCSIAMKRQNGKILFAFAPYVTIVA